MRKLTETYQIKTQEFEIVFNKFGQKFEVKWCKNPDYVEYKNSNFKNTMKYWESYKNQYADKIVHQGVINQIDYIKHFIIGRKYLCVWLEKDYMIKNYEEDWEALDEFYVDITNERGY